MEYKLSNNCPGVGVTNDQGIKSWIPEAEENADWQAYQRWLALGNTPTPADD